MTKMGWSLTPNRQPAAGSRSPGKILVIRLTSLGDVLLATPAVRAIKRGFPASTVSWLVEGSVAGLLAHQDFVDRVIEFPRAKLEQSLKRGRLLAAARTLFTFRRSLAEEGYDVVLDLHGIMKSAALAKMARADRRIGYDGTFAKEASWMIYNEKIGSGERRMHKVERNMLFPSFLGVEGPPEPELKTSPESDRYVADYLERSGISSPIIGVNPFCSTGSEFKRWDLANYGELMRRLGDETGATMMILWGPGEEAEAQRLRQMAGSRTVLACPTTVSQLLSLTRRMDLYIGGDTGVMHLAALAGVPVVAIFGPTDHLINGPYGAAHTIVRKEQPCSPCRDKSCTSRECIRSISVDDVRSAALAVWNKKGEL
jgi:lipopolysaccharide heptosyltransferase I